MTSRKLLLSKLLEKRAGGRACNSQVNLFRRKFGDAVEVTEELCVSVAGEFDWNWAARALLSGDYKAKFQSLRDDHKAKCMPLWDDYVEKCKPLSDDYEAKCKLLRDDYVENDFNAKWKALYADYKAKRKALWDYYEFQEKLKPLNDDYLNQFARLFARLYVEEGAT